MGKAVEFGRMRTKFVVRKHPSRVMVVLIVHKDNGVVEELGVTLSRAEALGISDVIRKNALELEGGN